VEVATEHEGEPPPPDEDDVCTRQLDQRTISDALTSMTNALSNAVNIWSYVRANGATQQLCEQTRLEFSELGSFRDMIFPAGTDCTLQASREAAARHWIDYYEAKLAEFMTEQQLLDARKQAIADQLPEQFSLLDYQRNFTAFDYTFRYPVGPVTVEVEIEMGGNWGVYGELPVRDQYYPTSIGVGAQIRPVVSAIALAYAGAGFGPVTFGVEGELLLFDLEAPVGAGIYLDQSAQPDERPPRVLASQPVEEMQGARYALEAWGLQPVKYSWNATYNYWAQASLRSLDGTISLAAQVDLIFHTKRFRKKVADWAGRRWPLFEIAGEGTMNGETLQPEGILPVSGSPPIAAYGEQAFIVSPGWLRETMQNLPPPNEQADLPAVGPCIDIPL
jgi:hypothetical protein